MASSCWIQITNHIIFPNQGSSELASSGTQIKIWSINVKPWWWIYGVSGIGGIQCSIQDSTGVSQMGLQNDFEWF